MLYYEILFGYMPYYGNTPEELYQKIITNKVKIPHQVAISDKSVDIIFKMLATTEKERISWQEMLQHPIFE